MIPIAPRTVDGVRNILATPHRKMFFGVGHYYYPRSRFSIGIWAIEEYAKRFRLTWEPDNSIRVYIADHSDFVLARPQLNWLSKTGKSLLSSIQKLAIPIERTVVIHHDISLELGDVKLQFGGRPKEYIEPLGSILDTIGTERYPRISVGVGHPTFKQVQMKYLPFWRWSDNHQQDWFLMNKFPDKEFDMVKLIVIPKIIKMMEYAMEVKSAEEYVLHDPMTYLELEETYRLEMKYRLEKGIITKEKLEQRRINPWIEEY